MTRSVEERRILTCSVARAARMLEIESSRLARIIELSEPAAIQLLNSQYLLNPLKGEWPLAVLFVRLFSATHAIFGDSSWNWVKSDNLALKGKPIELIQNFCGLNQVLQYLEAYRSYR